jgi:hypothetical protein
MTELDLERALADLGAHLEQPSTPPLAEAVMARIAEHPAPATPPARLPGTPLPGARLPWARLPWARLPWARLPRARLPRARLPRRGWQRVAVVALAVLVIATGIVVATPSAREAVARRLGLLGVEIHLGGPAPTSSTLRPGAGANLGLGRHVTLRQARAAVSFPLLVPTTPGFEQPDAVYLSNDVPGGRVDLVYLPRPGLRASPFSGVGLLITEFQATPFTEKFAKSATQVEQVTVGKELGYWLSGEPHGFVYEDRNGDIREETARLAGSTLVWTHGGLTLRLEGQVSKQQALRLANSMR